MPLLSNFSKIWLFQIDVFVFSRMQISCHYIHLFYEMFSIVDKAKAFLKVSGLPVEAKVSEYSVPSVCFKLFAT